MNKLLLTTAVGLVLGTAAFAQAPNSMSPNNATSNQTTPNQSTPRSQPHSTSTTTAPSSAAQTSPPAAINSAQTQTPPAASGPNSAGANTNSSQAPAAGNPPAQAQTTSPSPPPASQTQTSNPPTSNSSQAQQAPNAMPNSQTNTAQSPSTNVNAQVNLNDQQRTRISQAVSRLSAQPLTNVNFSLSVGSTVPRDVRLNPLPPDVVEIVPQYRGYNFVPVRDQIVIVDPSSYQIVGVLPYSGRSTAAAPAPREHRRVAFTDHDREVIRKHVRARPVESRTTGTSVRTEIRTGERVPESVTIEAFPEEVYRESPELREYRYIHRDNRTYIIEPQERRIIEEID